MCSDIRPGATRVGFPWLEPSYRGMARFTSKPAVLGFVYNELNTRGPGEATPRQTLSLPALDSLPTMYLVTKAIGADLVMDRLPMR